MILGDYHTHTPHSHGKSTMEQNIVRAIELGLKELAIADHGFRHMTYNVRRGDWHHIMNEHESLVQKYPDIKVYLGLETNLVSSKGDLDIIDEDLEHLQLIVAGFHKYVKSNNWKDVFSFYMPNFFAELFGKTTRRLLAKNTDAYINALERYPIDIISHPQYGITVDMLEVAKACAHYGTYLELNGKRVKSPDSEILMTLEKTQVCYIVNSDAHSLDRVGDFSLPMSVIERIKIPYERVANWDKLPTFRSHRK
ncbi:MAG: PHP domain-containing protein [Clostridiales bacterium]|jgi:putative hydrolase|nr:PHP domain-containing protein [Clostridiales bacterium]